MVKNNLITHNNPKSPISESLRTLRTNIQFTSVDKELKILLVTSALMNEGKSWVSSNLAIVFAQQDKKVLLIDADMRKGTQHKIFQLSNNNGLSNCLTSNSSVDKSKFIKETNIENLYIMTSGNVPPNPSELLSSNKMKELLDEMKDKFDFIIIDGPPSTVVTDGLILTTITDSTLLVVNYKKTTMEDLKNVKKAITNVGGNICGVVLNRVEAGKNGYYYKYYSYYSNEENTDNKNNLSSLKNKKGKKNK